MGTKQSCISRTDTEPKNNAKTNVHRRSSPPVKEKRRTKQRSIVPTGIEQNNSAKTNAQNMFSSPVQSQQVSDALFPTVSNFQVSPKTEEEVIARKQPKPIGRHTVFHTFDGKNEDDSSSLHERSNDFSIFGNEVPGTNRSVKERTEDLSESKNKSVAKTSTFTVETPCPSFFDAARAGYEDPRTTTAFKARHDLDKTKPTRKENTTLPSVETSHFGDADDKKKAESNAYHDASSAYDMNTVHGYERNTRSLEVGVSQLSAEKDRLLTRDAGEKRTAEGNENHASSSSNDMNRDHEYEQNVKRLESRVSQLRAEKDGLLNRLSEIGAIRLTENNPNVTDLGDPNRPEKVVEELSEIYDNEWTDVYEHLTKIRKKNSDLCAKKLLQILQEVFAICMSSTEKKRKALRKAITKYVGLTKEDQDEIDLKDIEKRIREYRRKKMQNNFKSLEEEVGDQLKIILKKETFDDLSEYIRSCVHICWKLCTREPPMHLDFGDSQQPAQSSNNTANKMHFDKAKFMSYTKFGDYIDYVVWPAVYLYKDGPLMKKGVAQGIQEDKEYKDGPDKSA